MVKGRLLFGRGGASPSTRQTARMMISMVDTQIVRINCIKVCSVFPCNFTDNIFATVSRLALSFSFFPPSLSAGPVYAGNECALGRRARGLSKLRELGVVWSASLVTLAWHRSALVGSIRLLLRLPRSLLKACRRYEAPISNAASSTSTQRSALARGGGNQKGAGGRLNLKP